MKSGRPYEELVHKIYSELQQTNQVTLDDKIPGQKSGVERQIDVSIRSQIEGKPLLTIIQVKDHKRRGDILMVDQFSSVIQDVGADWGILVCSSGFSSTVKRYAERLGIEVCSAHEADSKNWQTEVKIPVVMSRLHVEFKTSIQFTATEELVARTGGRFNREEFHQQFISLELVKNDGTTTTAFDEIASNWDSNRGSKTIGTHNFEYTDARSARAFGVEIPVMNIKMQYTVSEKRYFQFFTPEGYRGIKSYIDDTFKASFVRFDTPIPLFVDKSWIYTPNTSDLKFKSTKLQIDVFDFLIETRVRAKME